MRLDKFLKVSRILKRRSVAKDASDGGRVKVNGRTAKPSKDLMVGDICEIAFGDKIVKFEVAMLKNTTKKEDAEMMYKILES